MQGSMLIAESVARARFGKCCLVVILSVVALFAPVPDSQLWGAKRIK